MKKKIIVGIVGGLIFGFILILIIDSATPTDNKSSTTPQPTINEEKANLINELEGSELSYEKLQEWGTPETLEGTNNKYWVAYIESQDISFISFKETDEILFAGVGKSTAQEKLAEIEKEKEEMLEKYFSSWDGSHYILTQTIKESMNNPKSYEHVETVYWDQGDYLTIKTTFRGENAFGGTVKQTVGANFYLEDERLEIIE